MPATAPPKQTKQLPTPTSRWATAKKRRRTRCFPKLTSKTLIPILLWAHMSPREPQRRTCSAHENIPKTKETAPQSDFEPRRRPHPKLKAPCPRKYPNPQGTAGQRFPKGTPRSGIQLVTVGGPPNCGLPKNANHDNTVAVLRRVGLPKTPGGLPRIYSNILDTRARFART